MTLRELFINWLTASRFIKSLEQRIAEQRQDYTERLLEKDALIRLLRTEAASLKVDNDRLRAVVMPTSPLGAAYMQNLNTVKPPVVPAFSGPDDWQAELNKLYREEENNGIQSERREELHKSGSDEGA